MKRGDKVEFHGLKGTVVHVYGGQAQVRWEGGGITTTRVDKLTPAEQPSKG